MNKIKVMNNKSNNQIKLNKISRKRSKRINNRGKKSINNPKKLNKQQKKDFRIINQIKFQNLSLRIDNL